MSNSIKITIPTDEALSDFWLPDFCSVAGATRLGILAFLIALILLLAQAPVLWPFPFWDLFLLTILSGLVIAVSFSVVCRFRRIMVDWSHLRIAGVTLTFIIFNMVWISLIGISILEHFDLPLLSYMTNELSMLVRHSLIVSVFAGLFFRYLALQARLRRREQAVLNSRLEALQARIQPHFLFNSMNIIASLIAVDPEKAEQVVEDLAALFRASLRDTVDVSLKEEVSLCRRYAHIEELRLGEKLHIDWRLPQDLSAVRIPLLTLQPLLENAIRHGAEMSAEHCTISVEVSINDYDVHITLSNPLASTSRHDGNRMSMANVKARLQARFGPSAYLDAAPVGDQFVTRLGYPHAVNANSSLKS